MELHLLVCVYIHDFESHPVMEEGGSVCNIDPDVPASALELSQDMR